MLIFLSNWNLFLKEKSTGIEICEKPGLLARNLNLNHLVEPKFQVDNK